MNAKERFTSWQKDIQSETEVTPEPVEAEKTPLKPEVTPERIANDIRSLEKGETFCEDAHGDVYSAVYGILRKEKLQEPLTYKDGKICYVKK
jgi:hypothetical protein